MKIFYTVLTLVYVSWFWWYGGSGDPVTPAELEAYIQTMQSNIKAGGKDEGKTIHYMRDLAASDTGDQYLMINLIRYRDKAMYPPGSPWENDLDPQAANGRYGAGVVPLLLKRGGMPVLIAPVLGPFINDGDWEPWDDVSIVRYRSVRDMLEMMIEMSTMDLAVHKWASIEQTHVFPAQPLVSLFSIRLLVAGALFVFAVVVGFVVKLRKA